MKKKIFALMLCLAMVMSLLPTWAFAAEETTETWSITGIVVANERFCVDTDENGDPLNYYESFIDASGSQQMRYVSLSYVTDKGESLIYYEGMTASGDKFYDTMVINRALDDDMLGTKVTVNLKGYKFDSEEIGGYKNVEVVGDVILHKDTVVYTVPAIDTDIYPNGESTSDMPIRPYISFMVDGEEHKIEMSSDVAKYAKNRDVQANKGTPSAAQLAAAADIATEVNKYAYVLDDYSIGADYAGLYRHQDIYDDYNYGTAYDSASDTEFIADMGLPCLAQYRFVSVDGGETFSYMFKMIDDFDASGARGNIAYGFVSAYNRAAGTICFTGINGLSGTYDLGSEVVVDSCVRVEDLVVVYRENGKLVVEPVEVFNAAVEDFTTDGGVTLNGKTYYAWADCEATCCYSSLFEFYNEECTAMGASTTYYTYNNLILEVEVDDSASGNPSDYAVVLRSYYDADLDTAYVKLGFADGTEGTYKVGKLYTTKASDLTAADNNLPMELSNNSIFGIVVNYKILADGSVDLSGQDFEEIFSGCVDSKTKMIYNGGAAIVNDGKFQGKYAYSDDSIIFALYGNPYMIADGISVTIDPAANLDGTYAPVKAKAYKLSELKNLDANAIPNLLIGDYVSGGAYVAGADRGSGVNGSYILNTTKNANNYIVAAAVTVGEKLEDACVVFDFNAEMAYVVSARQFCNSETDMYYAEFTLVDENGEFTAITVDDVQNNYAVSMLDPNDGEGELDGKRLDSNGKPVTNWNGRFVRYAINDSGVITMLDTGDDWGSYVVDNDGVDYDMWNNHPVQGLYLVNLTGVRGDILSFYDIAYEDDGTDGIRNIPTSSLAFAEKGCSVINIEGGNYGAFLMGAVNDGIVDKLTFISSTTKYLPAADGGNAVIYVNEDGEIETIFSFSPNYVADGNLATFDEIEEVTVGDRTSDFAFGTVTYYNEEQDIICISDADPISGVYKISQLAIKGDIEQDSPVVCYKDGEDCVVEAVDAISGLIEDFTDDGGAVIGGETYYAWPYCEDIAGYSSFYDYCNDERLGVNTEFYVYNNWILDIDPEGSVALAENYAVILRSLYDADLDTAYVKLGFSDNTEGTYAIGKLYEKESSNPDSPLNDQASDFDLNAYVGMIVSYNIMDDGTVDLSGQYFKDKDLLKYYADGTTGVGYYDANGTYNQIAGATKINNMGVMDGKISFERTFQNLGDTSALTDKEKEYLEAVGPNKVYYPLNNSTVVFAIYGRPAYEADGKVNVNHYDGYLPLKARAFKLSELVDMQFKDIDNLYVNVGGIGSIATGPVGHVRLNSKDAANQYVVAASMTVGLNTTGIKYQETNALGYVVSAKQYYNAANDAYYGQFVLISEDGRIEAKTIEGVKDLTNHSVLADGKVGSIDAPDGEFPKGSFVRYHMNDEGEIDVLDISGGNASGKLDVKKKYESGAQSGLYLVNVVSERNGVVFFYDTDTEVILETEPVQSLAYHEDDGCRVIAIAEDTYAGEGYTFVSKKTDMLEAGIGNAVIQIEEGQIVRVFSFCDAGNGIATIFYDLNGGEGDIPGFTKRTGTDVPLSETVPVRENYIFLGWAESADATEAVYQPGDIYAGDANAVLYAVWKFTRLPGDANGDETVDFTDAMLVLKHDAGTEELTGDDLLAADANGDGETDFVDALLILQYDAGLVKEFK